jgi:hypothetical protein
MTGLTPGLRDFRETGTLEVRPEMAAPAMFTWGFNDNLGDICGFFFYITQDN